MVTKHSRLRDPVFKKQGQTRFPRLARANKVPRDVLKGFFKLYCLRSSLVSRAKYALPLFSGHPYLTDKTLSPRVPLNRGPTVPILLFGANLGILEVGQANALTARNRVEFLVDLSIRPFSESLLGYTDNSRTPPK
eukprot:sb/3474669/